jgi:hypothetical protein
MPSERKRFFFEKKKQKTFIHWSPVIRQRHYSSAGGVPSFECLRR